MDLVQGPVTTLHDFDTGRTAWPTPDFAAVVPMTARDAGTQTATGVIEAISTHDPTAIVVPIRSDREAVGPVLSWLETLDAAIEPIWCPARPVQSFFESHGVTTPGKGADVWFGLGLASAAADVVLCFDADVATADADQVGRLLAPHRTGIDFTKAYYARLEGERFYGRLFRLLYQPLLAALRRRRNDERVRFLDAFRYALAGEFAIDADAVRRWHVPARMGLEIGTLGEAHRILDTDAVAQVDLGRHEHHHRDVTGSAGLAGIAPQVTGTLFDVVFDADDASSLDGLRAEYRKEAARYVERYRRDAHFNDLAYDLEDERMQVASYAEAVDAPSPPTWLPAWQEIDVDPFAIASRSVAAVTPSGEADD